MTSARLLLAAFCLILSTWVHPAFASKGSGSGDCEATGDLCTPGEAYAAAAANVAANGGQTCAAAGRGGLAGNRISPTSSPPPAPSGGWFGEAKCTDGQHLWVTTKRWGTGCQSGTTWSDITKTCFNTEQCLSKPARTSGWYTGSSAMCHEGCEYDNPTDRQTFTAGGTTYRSLGGSKPTGQPCSPTEATKPLPEQPQYCQQVGSQTVCLKADTGEHCHSASAARQVCWKPGETGEKPDRDTLQKRNAGQTDIPPSNLNLPSGDTLQKQGDSATTTSTHTVNNTTTTITTTTTNYTTVNGTNAGGSKNQGESGTGDGTGKEGDGEGDGTASGGGSCTEPPATTGDPVLGMIARQSWETRCAVDKGNAANVTGDIGNCSQPFTVEGTNANAHELRALRAQICPQGEQPDPGQYSGEAGDPAALFGEEHEVGADGLDMTGLGFGQSCPSIPTVSVMGRTIAFDTSVFCDWMQLGGVFVRILAALWCLRVIGGA